ncbi:MAG: alpha/beta hydrolase [Planctomycetota bacterium]
MSDLRVNSNRSGRNIKRLFPIFIFAFWILCGLSLVHGQKDKPDLVRNPKTEGRHIDTRSRGLLARLLLLSDDKKNPPQFEFEKKGAIVYRKFDQNALKCDLYLPKGEGPFPAILAVHGGAWKSGTKFSMLRHAWRLAEAGYVVMAINYRHAPKNKFPAQIEDCRYAVRWLRLNADHYRVDPNQIGAFGYSAGGHLVSLLGTAPAEKFPDDHLPDELKPFDCRIKAVAAGGAPCEFGWLKGNSKILAYWLGGSKNDKPEIYRSASPTSFVTPDDPPFFFFHGESDLIVPPSSSLKLHEALKQSGVETQYHVAEGYGHIGTFSDLSWIDPIIQFFDRHLKK